MSKSELIPPRTSFGKGPKKGPTSSPPMVTGRGPLATLKKQFIENIKNFRVEETTNTIWALSELRRRCDICVLEVAESGRL